MPTRELHHLRHTHPPNVRIINPGDGVCPAPDCPAGAKGAVRIDRRGPGGPYIYGRMCRKFGGERWFFWKLLKEQKAPPVPIPDLPFIPERYGRARRANPARQLDAHPGRPFDGLWSGVGRSPLYFSALERVNGEG